MSLADDAAASPAADEIKAPAAQAETSPDAKPEAAATSSAEGDTSESMVDAVSAALNKDRAPEASPASEAKPEPTVDAPAKPPEAEDEEDDEDTEEEFTAEERAALNAKTRRSFDRLTKRNAELKEPAERFRKIETFMQSTGVEPGDVVNALNILALTKSDPHKALAELRNAAFSLSQAIGETLPADLQAKVEQGTIDEATAKELAVSRVRNSSFKTVAETSQAENEELRLQRVRGEITTSVTTWEKRTSERDPDFAAKQPLVSRAFKALVLEQGRPNSADAALRLMKQAYKEVSADFSRIRPTQRQEVVPAPASSATPAAAVPAKSMDDAIRNSFAA